MLSSSLWTLFLALELLLFVQTAQAANVTIFNWQPITGPWPGGRSLEIAVRLMVERMDAGMGFLRGGHHFEVLVEDSACAQVQGIIKASRLLKLSPAERPFAVLGCGCSGCSSVAAPILSLDRVPMVSPSATAGIMSDRAAFPHFFRVSPVDSTLLKASLSVFKSFGWTTIGMVIMLSDVDLWLDWWERTLAAMGMTDALAGSASRALRDVTAEPAREAVREVMRVRVRGIVMILLEEYAQQVFCHVARQNLRGHIFSHYGWFTEDWVVESVAHHDCSAAEMIKATEYSISAAAVPWGSPSALIPCDVTGTYTVADFAAEYERRRLAEGVERRRSAGAAADGICILAQLFNALMYEGKTLPELTQMDEATFARAMELLQALRFQGVSGSVSYPGDAAAYGGGDRLGPLSMYQRMDGVNHQIAFFEAGDGTINTLDGQSFKFDLNYTVEQPPPVFFPDCEAGTVYNFSLASCLGCQENKAFIEVVKACLAVPGYFEDATGAAVPCKAGTFSSSAGSTGCELCEAGRFSGERASSCDFCPRGTFAASPGSRNCTGCPDVKPNTTTRDIASVTSAACICELGTFEGANGACRACPSGSATLVLNAKNVSACECAAGSFMPRGNAACQPCPLGMECDLGSSEVNLDGPSGSSRQRLLPWDLKETTLRLLPGFYSDGTYGALAVFSCRSEARCPGGLPGECSPHLLGLNCEHCEDGRFWDGAACALCTSADTSLSIFPGLALCNVPLVTCVLYWLKAKEASALRWNEVGNTRNALLFVLLHHFQVMSITLGSVPQPGGVRDISDLWAWTTDGFALFNLECTGYSRFQTTFSMRSLAPAVVTVLMLGTMAGSLLLARATRRPEMAMTANRLFNVWGSVMYSFFGAVSALSLILFKCISNPNGRLTLAFDQSIVCYETDAWRGMLGVATAAVLVYVVGMGSLFCRVVLRAPLPGYFEDPGFQTRWAFLFIRYRPEAYWFSSVFLVKNFLVNLGFVLFSQGVWQLLWCFILLALYASLVVLYAPYRSVGVWLVELTIFAAQASCTFSLLWFVDRSLAAQVDQALGAWLATGTLSPLLAGATFLGVLLRRTLLGGSFKEIRRAEFVWWRRCVTKSLEMLRVEGGFELYELLGEWDQMLLRDGARLLEVELLGRTSRSRTCDKELFFRSGSSSSSSSSSAHAHANANANANADASAKAEAGALCSSASDFARAKGYVARVGV